MVKSDKLVFACQECGKESSKWLGRCPDCGQWNTMVIEARNVAQSQNVVPWLEIDRENARARVVALPKRENVQTPPINEQLIVELYSK